jgi:hypothetical protein
MHGDWGNKQEGIGARWRQIELRSEKKKSEKTPFECKGEWEESNRGQSYSSC